jgi:hypothetical protein
MTVTLKDEIICLEGWCGAEEAERLLILLQAAPGRGVDLARADQLHTALVQIIIAFRPPLTGKCGDPFLRDWVLPSLLPGNRNASEMLTSCDNSGDEYGDDCSDRR